MASRTLLQLFTLSFIFTNQIEARTFSKTHGLENNQEYDNRSTSVNKRSDKANESDRNNTVLMKKIYTPHFDQRSDTNESRHDILSRNKYNCKYKHIDSEEADSDKSQAEQQSDDNLKSLTFNRTKLTSLDNRKHFSNEDSCSEDTSQVNSINRKLVAEAMAQTIAIEKVKQDSETKLEPNDESSLQNYLEKENHLTVKPVRREKDLTVIPRNTKIRTTQENRAQQLIPKLSHKRDTKFEYEIYKTKFCNYKNHRSFEKISREHDAYKLKRRDESKTASKQNNNKKVNKNNLNVKHRFIETHRTFKTLPQQNSGYELKHRGRISRENDIYVRKHTDDFATVEEPVSKQVNPEYKPKFGHNFQKKRQRDKMVRKVTYTDKKIHNSETKHDPKTKHNSITKHDSEKFILNQEKYKPTLNENIDSVSETHTDIRKSDYERNANSGDTLNPDDEDTPTLENQHEKGTLESYQEVLKQNVPLNKPRLPFYVSSTTTQAIKEIFKEQPKELVSRKDEKETNILLGDLNTVLNGKSDLKDQNIDLNTTISRLASSKILDFITDRVAGQMLKKLEKSLVSKNNLITDPEMVEQIDILFKKDGDMVMKGREHIKEKEEDENDIRDPFHL